MSFREYEIKKKPLLVSLKRARSALFNNGVPSCCSINSFFNYLEIHYADCVDYIEFITFYDFVLREDKRRYTIAYIYTKPNLYTRDKLFDERETITLETGWYPMVSGSRANLTKIEHTTYWEIHKHKAPYVHLGKPLGISNVACDIASTALLLRCEKGCILLDTGFDVEPEAIKQVTFIFVSHFHGDHTRGLFGFLRQREVPVIMSGITLSYLLNIENLGSEDKERLIRNTVLIERYVNSIPINRTLEFFESYHCPGAYGVKYKYYDCCVIYPGDFCLENGFYNYKEQFQSLIGSRRKEYVLMDCALIPAGDFSITDNRFNEIVKEVFASTRNQVFLSRNTELLFNAYIKLFRLASDNHQSWRFIVSDELFGLLQSTLRTRFLRQYNEDPYIKHVIAKTGINYAESHKLFPVAGVEQFAGYSDNRLILFLSTKDLEKIHGLLGLENADLYITGRLANDKKLDSKIEHLKFNSISKLSSPDWSFHSDRASLKHFLYMMQQPDNRFILFHAYPSAIKKYIRDFSPEVIDKINIASKKEILLN